MTALGELGVWWALLGSQSAATERDAAREIERLGYGTLWFGESARNKDALAHAAILLEATERMNVATGIANIYVRDPAASKSGAYFLADASGGRFVLGLGVSHEPAVTSRGHDYGKPVSTMRAYLDAMDTVEFAPPSNETPPRVLAALRPKMLELAKTRTQGAHTYFAPPEHTARAREALGEDPVLATELAVVVDTDPESARAAAREYAAFYLKLPNYLNHLRELGFTDEDLEGSDALIDAVVAWGDPDTIAERVRAHHEAGADHVCVQPIAATLDRQAEHLRLLAPVLTA